MRELNFSLIFCSEKVLEKEGISDIIKKTYPVL